jgi:hypothetical protein
MWDYNLDRMNENKKSIPYSFPDSFYPNHWFHPNIFSSTVQTNRGSQSHGENLPVYPSYSQICSRRINKLDITSNRMDFDDDDDDDVAIIAADSTGIKVTNRGLQWMQDKWDVKNKKGYLKIHVAVNIKTKEILALEVTDEKVCMMERL